jgi:hypothetical protein
MFQLIQANRMRLWHSGTPIALALLLSLSPAVQAQSQSGGLPVTNERLTALEAVVVNLQAALAAEATARQALAVSLATETAARQALAASLATETAARQAADTAVQNAISSLQSNINGAIASEVAARQAADTNLTTAINNESAARSSGDTGLQNQVNAIQDKPVYYDRKGHSIMPNGDRTIIMESQLLPIGGYLVHFTAVAHIDSVFGDEGTACRIQSPTGAIWAEGDVAVHLFNGTLSMTTFVSIGTVGGGRIQVACDSSDHPASMDNAELFSIPITNLKPVYHD